MNHPWLAAIPGAGPRLGDVLGIGGVPDDAPRRRERYGRVSGENLREASASRIRPAGGAVRGQFLEVGVEQLLVLLADQPALRFALMAGEVVIGGPKLPARPVERAHPAERV